MKRERESYFIWSQIKIALELPLTSSYHPMWILFTQYMNELSRSSVCVCENKEILCLRPIFTDLLAREHTHKKGCQILSNLMA